MTHKSKTENQLTLLEAKRKFTNVAKAFRREAQKTTSARKAKIAVTEAPNTAQIIGAGSPPPPIAENALIGDRSMMEPFTVPDPRRCGILTRLGCFG